MFLPVDAAISAEFPGSQDALQQHAKNPGTQKDTKYSRGASFKFAISRAHLKGTFGASFEL